MPRFTLLTLGLFTLSPLLAQAQTSFPMITHTNPVAVQRGTTTEVSVIGRMNFYGTYKALFEGTGIQAEIVPGKTPDKPGTTPTVTEVKLKLTVAPDATLGVRDFRLASKLGISSIGQLVIVDNAVVSEVKDNNLPEKAQKVTLPTVLNGFLEAVEDVDYFQFEAKAGEHLTFEMFCARIQDRIHDLQKHAKPMLILYDSTGRELASNDCFYFADPMLSYTIPADGTYLLQIRESTYDGDPRWVYAILATNQPYASHVYPMAGNPGKAIEVQPVGSARKVQDKVALQVPAEPGVQTVQLNIAGKQTFPVTFLVSDLPQLLEQEDNNAIERANKLSLPCGINGRMDKIRDLDYYTFPGKKGAALSFQVRARQFGTLLNSGIHAVLEVMDAKGKILASNSDTHGPEAALVFTPAADGDYFLRVRDLNSKGGDSFVYFVEATPARQDFSLTIDPDKAMIGPGTSTAWFVKLVRKNGFTGPVQVDVKDLPKGVQVSPLTIDPAMTQGLMVVTAAKDAPLDAVNVQVTGTAKIKDVDGSEKTLVKPVTSRQEIYNPGGGRALFDVNLQTVCVTEFSDIPKVTVSTNKIVLKPGEEVKIEVTIDRHKDYTKGVSLDVPLRHLGSVYGDPLPPGVTLEAGKSKTLLGTGNKGHIVLKAAATATPVEDAPISVSAHVSINFVVKVSYSSEPILLSIRK